MAQFARPDADVGVNDGWTSTPLWSKVDDAVASPDGTTIASENNSAPSRADLQLSDVTDPEDSTGHTIRVLWNKDASGGHQIDGDVELWEGLPGDTGSTLIAMLTATAIGTAAQTDSYTLSGTEADSIADYPALHFRLIRNGDTGGPPGNRRSLVVDAVELETPDAAVAPPEGTGAIAGGGTLVGIGATTFSGTGAIAGGGTLQGVGEALFSGSGALQGGGTLQGVGEALFSGTGAISGGGTLQGTGETPSTATEGTGTLSGGGTLQGVGEAVFSGSGALQGGGVLSGIGQVDFSGTGLLQGGGTLQGTGEAPALSPEGTGALSGGGSLVGIGAVVFSGTGTLQGGGVVAGIGPISDAFPSGVAYPPAIEVHRPPARPPVTKTELED